MPIATTAWPKPYLLKLYERAVAEGCIRVHLNGDLEKYKSLTAAFYRLRRRKDGKHDDFIQPSFHLCTTTWEPLVHHGDGTTSGGTMLITYDKLPDGMELPEISSVDASEMPSSTQTIQHPLSAPLQPVESDEAARPDFDSEQFVRDLVNQAGEAIERDAAASEDLN